jgi:hypothetical protein
MEIQFNVFTPVLILSVPQENKIIQKIVIKKKFEIDHFKIINKYFNHFIEFYR